MPNHAIPLDCNVIYSRIAACPKLVTLLLPHIDLEYSTDLPVEMLSVIDEVLYTLYPPPAKLRSTCLECLHLTSDIVSSAPLPLLVSTLVALQKSLCCWIKDDQKTIPDEEYNIVVRLLLSFHMFLSLTRKSLDDPPVPQSTGKTQACSPFAPHHLVSIAFLCFVVHSRALARTGTSGF